MIISDADLSQNLKEAALETVLNLYAIEKKVEGFEKAINYAKKI